MQTFHWNDQHWDPLNPNALLLDVFQTPKVGIIGIFVLPKIEKELGPVKSSKFVFKFILSATIWNLLNLFPFEGTQKCE